MTTSTPAGQSTVSLRDPAQLIAATPCLLGFRPTDSLVVIAHRPPTGSRIGVVLRGDLPPPRYRKQLARSLVAPLLADQALGVTQLVVCAQRKAQAQAGGKPIHSGLVKAVSEVLANAGIPTKHALWVPEIRAGARYRCYQDPTCTGRLPDPATTVAATVMASTGQVTFGSRAEMGRLLDPVDAATLTRRGELLDEWSDSLVTEDSGRVLERDRREVVAALAQSRTGKLRLTDEQAVRLAWALSDRRIRDDCLGLALPAGERRAHDAERLWLELVRGIPAPERAEAACLLGFSAYLRGEGAFAGMALDNALDAYPAHVLAAMLAESIRLGVPPDRLTRLVPTGGPPDWLTGTTPGGSG
ncbi:protein of unknown function [Amycolatopsis marina]|uniref:DUF4192 domain-containing protein n=1 Tax=Amycolatopsis marina TaxID=490629 RepID=A0A1I1AIT3_9PSEU|nr:DUF4192 domain-containing protein [Amycolatopsis marina]SFB37941.1 protein of unknown function [Amycolatopsis marina]